MPIRNGSTTLERCFASIQAQTLRHFQVLAINDGSTDDTRTLIEHWASRDSRFQLINNPNPGLVGALNAGLALARSRIVARMDVDDTMHPQRLERQLDLMMRAPELTVVGCQVRMCSDEGEVKGGYRHYQQWQNALITHDQIAAEMFNESPIAHPSAMFRKDSVVGAGGYRDGQFPEDYELWLRLFEQGHRFGKVDEVMLDWYDSADRTSRVDARYSEPAFDEVRLTYLARFLKSRGHTRVVIWGAGKQSMARARRLVDLGIEIECWIDVDPKKIGKQRLEKNVISWQAWNFSKGPQLLILVRNRQATKRICRFLDSIESVFGLGARFVG